MRNPPVSMPSCPPCLLDQINNEITKKHKQKCNLPLSVALTCGSGYDHDPSISTSTSVVPYFKNWLEANK